MLTGLYRFGFKSAYRAITSIDYFVKLHVKYPHYYLFVIGVNPTLKNKGLGSLLMKPALALCDKENMPAYLENAREQNIPFYQKHGFEIIKEARATKACSPLWLMARKPQ